MRTPRFFFSRDLAARRRRGFDLGPSTSRALQSGRTDPFGGRDPAPTAAIWLDLLARYQSAVDAYEERSDAVSACLAEGSIASDEEITAEQITRERLVAARSALWRDWSDPYKYEPKRAWTEFC